MTISSLRLFAALSLLLSTSAAATVAVEDLAQLAPDADPQVLRLALQARACAIHHDEAQTDDRLAVIDYSRPSTERRLWVFELSPLRLLYSEHVAHGRGSGENLAKRFSNIEGSHQSSLGLFRTAETYQGGNGYSLRMDGLEPGINDRARSRAIVMHGAPYVNPEMALRQGRLGRSFGCPAVRREVAQGVIDSLKQGQLLFAYYPDATWLNQSTFLQCAGSALAQQSLPDGNTSTDAAGAP
jgi:hypothetical protein